MIHRSFKVASPLSRGVDLGEGGSEGQPVGRGIDWIRGDVRFPEGPAPRTAVVVVHGFKGFKDFGFFPYLCDQLARRGHAVVNFNFSCGGIGEQPQEFTELEAFARNTYTRELAELRHVVDMIAGGDFLPRRVDRIGLVGHSRGGGSSIIHVAEDDRIDGLVTWGAISRFDRWTPETIEEWRREGRVYVPNTRTGQHMPLDLTLLEDFESHRDRLDIRASAARITKPWLILHGEDDLTVGLADAEAFVAANPEARMITIERADHVFEAKHPFKSVPPQLDEAIELTVDHFRIHWDLN